jgi:hypothetical protein
MLGIGGAAKRELRRGWHRLEGRARLYQPDASDLDTTRHLSEAMAWLMRAQDAGADAGVSYGVFFGHDFDVSYPETTGYICQTFVERELATGDADLLRRAVAMGDWEIEIQMPAGAVMGGKADERPTPAVFNTGMVLLGWSALIRRTGADRFARAARRASDWLIDMQDPSGHWGRGNSKYAAAGPTLYNVMAAWGLCEAGLALEDERFIRAAVRNGEYCLSRQHENGWLPDCCLTDPRSPLLHTLAYSMQGLIGIGQATDRDDLVAGARLLADAVLRVMGPDGFIPGRLNADFSAGASWCCLTGSAQTSAVWSDLHALTGDARYGDAALSVNRYLMARHDIRNPDPRLRGGVAGSWPVDGGYGTLRILNWATKFFVDALSREDAGRG